MNQDQITGALRAVIAAVGGYLAGKGAIDNDMLLTLGGLAAPLAAIIWSLVNNKTGKTIV